VSPECFRRGDRRRRFSPQAAGAIGPWELPARKGRDAAPIGSVAETSCRADAIAGEANTLEVKSAHLFLQMLEEDDFLGCWLLEEEGTDLRQLGGKVRERLVKEPMRQLATPAAREVAREHRTRTPFLDQVVNRYGRDLT